MVIPLLLFRRHSPSWCGIKTNTFNWPFYFGSVREQQQSFVDTIDRLCTSSSENHSKLNLRISYSATRSLSSMWYGRGHEDRLRHDPSSTSTFGDFQRLVSDDGLGHRRNSGHFRHDDGNSFARPFLDHLPLLSRWSIPRRVRCSRLETNIPRWFEPFPVTRRTTSVSNIFSADLTWRAIDRFASISSETSLGKISLATGGNSLPIRTAVHHGKRTVDLQDQWISRPPIS